MRPHLFTDVLPFADALARTLDRARPIDRTERVALADADCRVAAVDVTSGLDVPGFDRAAMDGYALIAADTVGASAETPSAVTAVGGVFTGDVPTRAIVRGECMEIATGAPVPDGADAVVMVEQTDSSGQTIRIFKPANIGQNIGRRGADIKAGQKAIATGDALTPSRIGALAAIGVTSVDVFARPSVAILSTGNEVVAPGETLSAGQVYDINQFTVSAIVRRHGGIAVPLPVATDTLEQLHASLDAAAGHDIIVFSGGSSVGGRDLLVDLLHARGEVIFHGIAVKPGKPTLFGRVGRSLVFGMPGYPTSCLSNAYMLLLPLLRRVARLPAWQPETRTLPLSRRISSAPDRHQFYTVRIANGQAEPAFKSSGDITSMATADGFIEIPAGVDGLDAGASVTVKLF